MIEELVQAFAAAAGRLQQGGFDGCEVMASHCHLIDQFWTPNANRRDDDYGGDLANRLRFGVQVLEAVRERVGSRLHRRHPGDRRRLHRAGPGPRRQMQEIAGRLNETGLARLLQRHRRHPPRPTPARPPAVPNMSFTLGVYAHLAAAIRAVGGRPGHRHRADRRPGRRPSAC